MNSDIINGTVLESIFNSKIMNRVDYDIENKKRQQRDAEMREDRQVGSDAQLSSKDKKILSTKQKQLEYLKAQRYNNPGNDVNEDAIVRDLLFIFQGIEG
jgi:hypothetical protein